MSRLVEEAWSCVHVLKAQRELQDRCELQEVLLTDQLSTVFQPIVELRRRRVLGYEALSRGPAGSVYQMPLRLFEMAAEADLVFELDRKCRRRALVSAAALPSGAKLFVNVFPSAMYDPEFQGTALVALAEAHGLTPDRVVLEITEKSAIENYGVFVEALVGADQARLLDRGRRRRRRLLRPREDRAPEPALPQVRPRARAQHRLELHPARDDARAQGVRRPASARRSSPRASSATASCRRCSTSASSTARGTCSAAPRRPSCRRRPRRSRPPADPRHGVQSRRCPRRPSPVLPRPSHPSPWSRSRSCARGRWAP